MLKKFILIWLLAAASALGQSTILTSSTVLTGSTKLGLTLLPGWHLIQDAGMAECTGDIAISTCTSIPGAGGPLPHLPGDVVMAYIVTNTNLTISSMYGCTVTSGTCTSSNATETFSLASGSACHLFGNSLNVDAVYLNSAVAGTTTWTMTLSTTTSSSSYTQGGQIELAPPAGYTGSYSGCGTNSSASSTNPTAATVSPAGTDAIVQVDYDSPNWPSGINAYSGSYLTDVQGNGLCLNCTSGTAPTVTYPVAQTSAFTAMDFTSTAGKFAVPASVMTLIQYSTLSGNGSTQSCGTGGCTFALLQATGSGNLLVLNAACTTNSYLSSVTGAGTWVVPSGMQINTNNSGTTSYLSTAYALSSTSGVSSLTPAMTASATCGFALWEVNKSSGTWALDSFATADNENDDSAYLLKGPPLSSATGSNDAVFEMVAGPGSDGADTVSYQIQPGPWQASFNIGSSSPQCGNTLLLNTNNFALRTWFIPPVQTTIGTSAIAFE